MPKPQLEEYLRAYYQEGSQHQEDEWPPSYKVKYINLILVQQSRKPHELNKAKGNIGMLTKGRIKEFEQDNLSLVNIMKFDGRVCIINGAPGVGKTTLALKLRKDWAERKLLNDFHLVLYIPLRTIARLSENLDELLNYFDSNCNEADRQLIKRDNGRGVLFILDGWDELKPSCRGKLQFFPRLISGIFLPNSRIVVTSRPGASVDICNDANQIIEVLGFGKMQVEEYIQAYFSQDAECDSGSKLIDDLEKYPDVASTCYVAINLSIVCHVYYAQGYKLPHTLTEVYKWFIIHTILRYLQKKRVSEEMEEELPPLNDTQEFFSSDEFHEKVESIFKEPVRDMLHKLGKLAFNGVANDDLCFNRRDLVKTCNLESHDDNFDGFGLLKPVHICHSVRSESYYHFLHLSIQEFIAAFYLSQLKPEEQFQLLKQESKYNSVIKFLCGIDKFKSKAIRILFRHAEPKLFHFECIYEGQWKDYCKEIARQCSNTFRLGNLNSRHTSPQQWEVLGYVMSSSGAQWHFKCYNQYVEKKSLTCFSRHLSNRVLHHISLENMHIRSDAFEQLSTICQSQVGLTSLDIIDCSLNDDNLVTITKELYHHSSLERICIQDRLLTSEVHRSFLALLPTLPKINCIKLDIENFSNEEYQAIKQCASTRCNPPPSISCGSQEWIQGEMILSPTQCML